MESTASTSSKKETLVAFRIAANDVDSFKQMAEDQYKRGEIKTPTIAALCKRNLYWTCSMLKDLEKARILADKQRQRLISLSQLEEQKRQPRARIKDYDHQYRYYDNTYPSTQMPASRPPQNPDVHDITLRNQSGQEIRQDYNYDYNCKSISRPFFYELYPDWKQMIAKTGTERKQRRNRNG